MPSEEVSVYYGRVSGAGVIEAPVPNIFINSLTPGRFEWDIR